MPASHAPTPQPGCEGWRRSVPSTRIGRRRHDRQLRRQPIRATPRVDGRSGPDGALRAPTVDTCASRPSSPTGTLACGTGSTVHHTRRCDRGSLDHATQHLDLFEPHPQLDGIQRRHIDIEQTRQRHRRPTDRITSLFSRRPLHHRADEPQPDRIHTINTGGSHHLVDVNRSHASIMTKGYPRVGETICPRERSPLAAPTTAQGVMTTLPTVVRSISERSASPARSSG